MTDKMIKGLEIVEDEESIYSDLLPRGYLSVSQVSQFTKCGEAYRQRYILEIPSPPTSFQVQGRNIHRAAEMLHISMIGGSVISKEEMTQIYSDEHDKEFVDIKIDEDTEGTADQIKDMGVRLTRKYYSVATGAGRDDKTGEALPAVDPISAEKKFRVMIEHEDAPTIPFFGIIDLEEPTAIADLKTKKKAASQLDTDNSIQLSIYAHVTGKPFVRLDQLVKPTKKQPERFIRTVSTRTKKEVLHALDIVSEVAEDIAAGRFRRTNPENWWCTSKWCPYWGGCRGRTRI